MNRIWILIGIILAVPTAVIGLLWLNSLLGYRQKLQCNIIKASHTRTLEDDKPQGICTISFDLTASEEAWMRLQTSGSPCFNSHVGLCYKIADSLGRTYMGKKSAVLERVSGGKIDGDMLKIAKDEKVVLNFSVRYEPTQAGIYRVEIMHIQFFLRPISDFPTVLVPRKATVALEPLMVH